MATGGNNQTLSVTIGANMDPSGVLSAVKQMQSAFSGLKLPGDIGANLEKSFDKATDLLKKYQTQLSKGINTKTDAKNITKTGSQINEVLDEIVTHINSINGQQIFLKADVSGLNTLKTNIENARTAWKNAIQEFRKGSDIEKVLNEIAEKTTRSNLTQGSISSAKTLFDKGDLEGYRNALDDIYNRLKNLKDTTIKNVVENLGLQDAGSKAANLDQIKKRLEDISKIDFSGDSNVDTKFKAITTAVTEYETEVKRASQAGQNAFNNINVNKAVKDTRDLVDATDQYKNSVMSAKDQVQQLQQSTQYFFSLRNMINLLKRGIDEAVQSVKDLDKAMTETAVVTDFSVGDMWEKLPEYTKNANALGASVTDMYKATTLYYQQGLNTEQSMSIAAETMKMARIGGLEAADATDKMTAALRGFNMEINEASAQRVNDVYSNLAAKTASNTEELGTAMQRTASIAASAGMSFEGTAAFLAQAIETTREPAENLGTAMKTIVARFTELKKNPLEIAEVDGEEVSYNKVDTALQSIGVSLKDANGQFRDLDQVFLDISQRWNSLSQTQQRYIATIAAGSRQQSRFIAMMSNYDRTVQLMDYANNSAGASNEQFGKTMESLEAKLNKLKNAWQQFEMGIANNGMIKLAVDGLTGFLNVTNKIIDTLSLGSGVFKSFLSILAAFTGLKVAGRAANSLIGGLGGLVDPQSTVKEGLKIGLFGQGKNAAQAKAITTPIVGSLSKISGQIAAIAKRQGIKDAGQKGSTAGVKESSKEDYANTKKLFSQLSGKEGFKMGDASKLFGNLDAKHQLSMFNNNPGTKQAMKRASMNWFSGLGLSPELEKEGKIYVNSIYKGMKEGQIPVDKGIELIGQPQKWGQYFGTETAQAYSKSFIKESIPAMEESTQIAHEAAMYSLGLNPNDYKVGSDEIKQLFKDKNNKQLKEDYAALYGDFRKDIEKSTGHEGAKGKVSDLGRFANDIGAVADKFTQAGYGITTFGNALSQLGGPLGVIGSGIAAFGGAISTIGASISGATGIISLFTVGITDATGAVVVAGSTIAAVAAPLAAAAGIFLLVRAHLKKVKEAGEEVTNTFNETNKTAEDNIAKLKSYQSEFATLSKGVDTNGNNVSLDDSQYQRYLEIVDDIAAINPEIVEGYNAQGHAIINNNKALAETLKKQQEIRDEAYKTYTEEGSLQKLINARNISSEYRNSIVNPTSSKAEDAGLINNKKTPFAADVRDIADLLGLSVGVKDFDFTKYGIDSLDALKNGEEKAVQNFVKHRQQIETDLSNSGIKLSDAVVKGFNTLGDDASAFDEAIKPVYDNLLANVSNSSVFESIAPEFRAALQTGLKDLASQDLDAPEMAKAANNMALRFANLTNGSGKYKDALEIVEQAQDNFASSLDETQYKADVQPAIDDLTRLKEEALDEGSAYGDALAEYLENQIQRISNFTQEGGANLTEALNTATDEIAAAEGALDSFNEATKKDFATAAEGMKGIFDKTTETFKDSYGTEIQKHAEGMGDATFWTGAEALLSEKEIERLTKGKDGYEAAEAVKKRLEGLEPILREGQEGFDAFTDRVLENADAMDKLAEAGVKYDKESGLITNIPDDQWHNVAEALGISDDLLTSMLNKGRQFADISFMNVEDARKALAASDYTIQGNSSTAGNKNLYVKEDTLRMELSDAGYVRREQQDEQIKKLLAQGVKTIPASDSKELTQDKLKDMADDWGVKTLPDLIQTLNDTGDFTKDEIQEYAEKLDLIGDLDFDTVYSDLISALDNPELAKQTQELAELHGTTTAILDQMSGNTPEKQMQDAESLRKDTFGGDGVDTAVEAFGQGKKLGKDGTLEFMTPEEFATQSKYVSDLVDDYNKAAKQAQINADATTGATSKSYQQVADYYTKLAADTQREYERGLANYESNLQRQENAAKKTADREESIRQAKAKKIPKNAKANEDNKTKTPGQTKTETIETTTKKTNTEKNETTKKTTIVDGKTTPGFKETEQATESLEDKDGMVVNVATKAELAGANSVIKTLGNINDKTVAVKTEGDTSGAIAVKNAIANVTGKIVTIGTKLGNTSAIKTIDDQITALARKGNNIKIGTTVAIGQNNYIPHQSIPSFGSAARGRGGTIGPRNRGGLTLTGEKGFEIAWLPKENRSMILGAGGPQMLNLPSDAVVYTHEQSKKILKRKGIPAGSHADEEANGSSYKKKYTKNGSKVVVKTQKKKTTDKDKGTHKQQKKNVDNAAKVIKKAGNVNAWWWNMGKKVEATQRIIDKTYKQIEKLIKKAGTTIDDLSEDGDLYIKKLNQQISLNTKMRNKADDKLTILDNGPSKASKEAKAIKKAQDRVDKAEKKVKKAKTAKEKAAAKDELKKAKKNLKKKQKTANYSTISYDVTTVKKDKKGKKTKSKKTKKQKVDLSKFIKYDEATEAYIIDYKKINSKNWDKSKKKAVMEAAQKKIEDYQKKRDTAEDNIDKAQEALEKFGAELYENFNAWENELTQIYFITKKIEETEKRIAGAKTSQTLQQNRLMSGLATLSESFKKLSYQYFQVETHGSVRNINDRNNQINLQKQNVLDIVKGTDLMEQRSDLLRQLVSAKDDTDRARINAGVAQLTDELKVISQAQKYIRPILNGDGTIELNFDADTFARDRNGTGLSATTAEKIQEYIKKIQEANGELLDLYETQVSDLNELYETLVSLQEQYLDYSNQLLEAIEKEAADRVEKIKTLSNIVSDNFKELIDSVKSQLDQRRQQEDNSKTERDIVRKQNRLALLRANSAGGNVVAAAQLEQEIADAQQSYGRTLEDQLLDKLQQTEDRAAKQREQQIKILEAQLELNKINGVNTGRVADLMDHPERYQTEITRLIKYSEDYNRQTREGQANINTKIQGILQNLDTQTGIPARILDVKTEIQKAEKSLEETLKNFLNTALKQTVDVDASGGAGAELAKVLGDLKEQQDKLQEQLKNLNSQRDTLKAQLDTAVKDTEKKYGLLQTAKSQLSSAESQLSEARKSGNQQKISAAQQRYNNAKTNYNNANQAWTTARNKEQQLRGKIVTIDNQIKQVTTQLNDVKTQYEQTNQEYSEITGEVIPVNTDFTSEDKANQEANAKQIAEKEYSDYLLARKKAKSLSTAQINTLFDKGKAAGRTKKRVILDILKKDSFTGLDPFTWKNIIKELINANGITRWNLAKTWPNSEYLADALLLLSDKNYPNKMAKIKKHEKYKSATTLDHYKQGGLADYTGPAWLDGTPSKPELVLNSTDTKNLIALKDVLSKVMKGSLTATTENQGDILYEININVDKIEKDYDVDQVVDKVKKEIVKSAGYRNVTQVRNFR